MPVILQPRSSRWPLHQPPSFQGLTCFSDYILSICTAANVATARCRACCCACRCATKQKQQLVQALTTVVETFRAQIGHPVALQKKKEKITSSEDKHKKPCTNTIAHCETVSCAPLPEKHRICISTYKKALYTWYIYMSCLLYGGTTTGVGLVLEQYTSIGLRSSSSCAIAAD